ncbi:MAG: protein-disulfide reductase DsbD [Melioribacteraceae bacterium]|nr:protein-disulfide reductase DsbD [Melioribacteraceae bacterium]
MYRRFIQLIILFVFTVSVNAQFGPDVDLVKADLYQSFEKIHSGSQLKFAFKLNIEDTWHINSDKPNEDFLIASEINMKTNENFNLLSVVFPKAKEYNFGFSDVPVSVFEGEVFVGGVLQVNENAQVGIYEIPIEFIYQACNDVTCMPPNSIRDTITVEVVDKQTSISEINGNVFSKIDLSYVSETVEDEESLANQLESSGLLISLLLVFLGGLALNLTPCVYPLIPITVGYFGGQSEGRTGKLFILGVLYVLGMSVTYSVIGVVTSLSGAVFGALLQNPIVIVFIALVFVVLSLSMFGLYEFKLPDSLVMKAGGAKSGALGALFMGLTMGIVAAPCIGPFVIGLVTYVAAKGDPFFGFLMFFFLAIGLGTPYLFLALFSGKIKQLPRAGFWMEAVKHIFGFLLLGMALYFIGPLLPKEVNYYLLPIFGILAGLILLFVDKKGNEIKGFRIFKYVFSILVIALSVYMIIPSEKMSPDWEEYTHEKYEAALANNDKILIDFYADWCIPCKELDALTFSDPRVIEKSKEFVAFKVDMTRTMDEFTEQIRDKFSIVGMPTVLMIDSNGDEAKRLTGYVNADEFLDMLLKIN